MASASVKVTITADATQLTRQLRIIARHVLALADELDIELRPWPLAEEPIGADAEPGDLYGPEPG